MLQGDLSCGDQPGAIGRADEVSLVSQNEQEATARSQGSFDQNGGRKARWRNTRTR
jgi:hypothetical protein